MRALTTILFVVALLGACAAQPKTPVRSPRNYPGQCALLGIEEVEAASDAPSDQIALVASYRFGAASTSSERFALTFRVTHERADELRSHLSAHPNVVCHPDPGSAAGYDVALPALADGSSIHQ